MHSESSDGSRLLRSWSPSAVERRRSVGRPRAYRYTTRKAAHSAAGSISALSTSRT